MRLGTLRAHGTTRAVRVDGSIATPVGDIADVGALLQLRDWVDIASTADGPAIELDERPDWAPVIVRPGKIICVGLNYRSHIEEMGRELPEHPTLFAKFPEALIGAYDAIQVPIAASSAVDWEGELAVIIGKKVRNANAAEAADAIAGYSVLNDVTMRDYQYRTAEWFQGKTFEATAPFGPVLLTAGEFTPGAEVATFVDGKNVQRASTDDLVFTPVDLIRYISTIVTLNPGDVIATGTPGGVGHSLTPKRHLQPGESLRTEIQGIGVLENTVLLVP